MAAKARGSSSEAGSATAKAWRASEGARLLLVASLLIHLTDGITIASRAARL